MRPLYYKTLNEIKKVSYLSDLSPMIDTLIDSELISVINKWTSAKLYNRRKYIRDFINYKLYNWNSRFETALLCNMCSLNYYIALYGDELGTSIFTEKFKFRNRNRKPLKYFMSVEHLLNQKPFKTYKSTVSGRVYKQLKNLIIKFEYRYLLCIKKDMLVNMLKYNVPGNWTQRICDSENYKRDGFSLKSCQSRYGIKIGKMLFEERIDKVKCKRENYTKKEWIELCKLKKSNLGLDGYIKKHGIETGTKKWESYLTKWKIGISNRKARGNWKSGCTLDEFQLKWGIKEGFKRWDMRNKKWKASLSLDGYIKKYGKVDGKIRWDSYCKSNNKTSYDSFILRYGEDVGNIKYREMTDKHAKHKKIFGIHSKISQELFDMILKLIDDRSCQYGSHGGEEYFYVNEPNLRSMYVDFKCGNIIIEFHGDYWHMNPRFNEEADIFSYKTRTKTAKEIWKHDKRRIDWLKKNGYKVLVIWEYDYNKNKEQTIHKCIKFINKNYEKTQIK